MLACVLRPSDRGPASVVTALIKRLLVLQRRAWPKTKIIVRADSGACRPRVLQRLEHWGLSYIIGLQKNSRLAQQVQLAELALAEQYAARKTKQRMFGEFEYAALTWDKPRRVIARLEHGAQGANPRLIVTDLPGPANALYERRYCARIRTELLKIGAAVLRNKRRVRVLLASAHTMKHVFIAAARALGP